MGNGMEEGGRAEQVELAAQGDADALQRLILYYHAALQASVQAAMDADLRRRVDPEDVLQQAYVAAFRSAASCEGGCGADSLEDLPDIEAGQREEAHRLGGLRTAAAVRGGKSRSR